jgi:FtsK/SpoIIIE family
MIREQLSVISRQLLVALFLVLSGCATPTAGGFDPNLAAAQAQLTAEAAKREQFLYSQMATGTAQAPIIAITQQAAQLSFSMTQGSINQTATAIFWTPTSTPIPTITPSATANATTTAVFNASRAESTQVALSLERAEMTNQLNAFKWYTVGAVVLIAALTAAYMLIKRYSFIPHQVDERGKAIPMISVLDGVAFDIERSANGMIGMGQKFLKQLPQITAERQDATTARAQMVDMATRARLSKRLMDEQRGQLALPAPVELNTNFLLPSWDIINGWDGKNGIPYYTARGLETIDIDQHPHLSVLGITGSGKSRRFARPVIACALAAGHRVVIIGKSTDYWPFEAHPNATLLTVNKFTEPGQAARYAKILEAIVVEMNRRDDVLTAAHRSTWTHAGRNRTWIILDEFGNALRLMDKATSSQCALWVQGLVAEGRKVGFNLMITNQRATGMPAILSQTGKAIFRIEKDEERAHHSLAGASSLGDGYFLAKFGASKIAGAFEPTDDEIHQFLASRPAEKLEDEDQWIDAVATDVSPSLPPTAAPRESLPAGEKKDEPVAQFIRSLNEQEYKALDMYLGGSSQAKIEREVFGGTGGSYYMKVADIIRRYKAAAATTTTQITPILGSAAV